MFTVFFVARTENLRKNGAVTFLFSNAFSAKQLKHQGGGRNELDSTMNFIKSVEAFTLAVEKGNFTNAANALDITPSMLAREIRELEHYLGCKLLHRTTRKQGVTIAGERYYRYCVEMLEIKKQAQDEIHQLNGDVVGNIRMSSPVAFGNKILSPVLAQFLLQYPNVNIDLMLCDRRVDLIEENIQIAVRVGQIVDDGLVAYKLPPYQQTIVASPQYLEDCGQPQTPEELGEHNCISFSQWHAHQYWLFEKNKQIHKVRITPRLLSNTGESIRQSALNGLGIAVHSTVILAEDIEQGRLIRILPDYEIAPQPINILRPPMNPVTPAIDTLIHFMLDKITPSPVVI